MHLVARLSVLRRGLEREFDESLIDEREDEGLGVKDLFAKKNASGWCCVGTPQNSMLVGFIFPFRLRVLLGVATYFI